ncbi:unnamed protein product [Commensalibacter communis]|uniref:hypothetical protein n=1 Tax=Commensalibacter communis TaxID=2972786 RepID=UPI0022FF5F52|nr:hypothetical protein [Commensalibacter communis]CAI3946001.1 unnamed protein product [Commensalibacter communis]
MNIDVNKIKKSFIISLSLPLVDCHQNINNIQNAKIYKNFVKHQTLPNMTRNDYFQIISELIEVYHDNPVVLDELLDIELSYYL